MKVGDLVRHRDRIISSNPPGIVLKVFLSRNNQTLVDVYWTASDRTICAYTPNELVAFDESR